MRRPTMNTTPDLSIHSAEIVLPAPQLHATVAFFTEQLGFVVDAIIPADDPAIAVISGHGVRLRLERDREGAPGVLRLRCTGLRETKALRAPNGTIIEKVSANPEIVLPALQSSFVINRAEHASWIEGRAGMRYRDLIPGRQGGRFVASHIVIPDAGPVPDYVHFHRVHFQLIFCRAGWVRLVYEDQGPPFVLRAGDCVVQPPMIRHRVLESSAGLEVVELGCPAIHETWADHELGLPTETTRSERSFAGQRFTLHRADEAVWSDPPQTDFESADTGIAAATDGVASVHVHRISSSRPPRIWTHDAELVFGFVLAGGLTLHCEGEGEHRLASGDAFVVPPARRWSLTDRASSLELLEVTLPANAPRAAHPEGAWPT